MLHTQIVKIIIASLLLTVLLSSLAAAEKSETKATPTPKATATPDTKVEQININTVSLDELVTLPGIGPKTAQKIVDGRPFETVDAILNVKGIGSTKLEKIRRLITVGKPQDETEEQKAKATAKDEDTQQAGDAPQGTEKETQN